MFRSPGQSEDSWRAELRRALALAADRRISGDNARFGAFADRMRFSALVLFNVLWSLLVYAPVAHWVWEPGGWLAQTRKCSASSRMLQWP